MPKGVYVKRTSWSKETREKIMSYLIGHKHTEKTKNKIREKAKLRRWSLEDRLKLSRAKRILTQDWILFKKTLKRLPEYKFWIKEIYKRDNYTCQKCFEQTGKLEAHHIKPISVLVSEFSLQYNQFSISEDFETLLRIALNHQPFWEIQNGKTLCKKCHNKEKSATTKFITAYNSSYGLLKNSAND